MLTTLHMTRFRWTIKRKLLALGIGTLLPLLLILAFWVTREFREHTETAQRELALASQQAASSVEELLAQLMQHLLVLARDPAVQRRQVGRMEELFRQALQEHPGMENVFAVAADGHAFASVIPLPAGTTFTAEDRPWFRQVVATSAPVVGDFQIGRFTGYPIAALAVPLRDQHDAASGVLVAGLSLRRLHSLFQFLHLAAGMTVTVVDGGDRILSQAPIKGEGWIGKRLPSVPAARPGGATVATLALVRGWRPDRGGRPRGRQRLARAGRHSPCLRRGSRSTGDPGHQSAPARAAGRHRRCRARHRPARLGAARDADRRRRSPRSRQTGPRRGGFHRRGRGSRASLQCHGGPDRGGEVESARARGGTDGSVRGGKPADEHVGSRRGPASAHRAGLRSPRGGRGEDLAPGGLVGRVPAPRGCRGHSSA